jgi:hypothetical protein
VGDENVKISLLLIFVIEGDKGKKRIKGRKKRGKL